MLEKFVNMSPATRYKNLQRSESPELIQLKKQTVPETVEAKIPDGAFEPPKDLPHPLALYHAIDKIQTRDEIERKRK